MSIRVMTWVWDNSPHKGSALLLLLAIADMANDDGVSWPGLGRLAKKTRLGRRYIIDLIDELEKAGSIEVKRRKDGEINLSNIYKVVCDASLVNPRPLPSEPQTTTPGEPQDTKVVNPSSPKPSINHQIEPSKKRNEGRKKSAPDPLLENPAIKEYRQVAKIHAPIALRQEIADTVKDIPLWHGIIYDWIGNGWNKQNLRGMLDAYRAGGIQRKNGNGNGSKPTVQDERKAGLQRARERYGINGNTK